MTITVNGRKMDYIAGESINRLLKRLRYIFPLVVIKINGEIVPTEDYIATVLADGDMIDIIHLTSGG